NAVTDPPIGADPGAALVGAAAGTAAAEHLLPAAAWAAAATAAVLVSHGVDKPAVLVAAAQSAAATAARPAALVEHVVAAVTGVEPRAAKMAEWTAKAVWSGPTDPVRYAAVSAVAAVAAARTGAIPDGLTAGLSGPVGGVVSAGRGHEDTTLRQDLEGPTQVDPTVRSGVSSSDTEHRGSEWQLGASLIALLGPVFVGGFLKGYL